MAVTAALPASVGGFPLAGHSFEDIVGGGIVEAGPLTDVVGGVA